jgi:hypothetical protein
MQEVPGVRIERRALLLLSVASAVFLGCCKAHTAALEDEAYADGAILV